MGFNRARMPYNEVSRHLAMMTRKRNKNAVTLKAIVLHLWS